MLYSISVMWYPVSRLLWVARMSDELIQSILMSQWTFSFLLSLAWCKQQENGDLCPQYSLFWALKEKSYQEHQAERGHSLHRVCLHLGIFVRVYEFLRGKDCACSCVLMSVCSIVVIISHVVCLVNVVCSGSTVKMNSEK